MPRSRYSAQRYVTCVFFFLLTSWSPIVCPVSPTSPEASKLEWATAVSGGEVPPDAGNIREVEATPDLLQKLSGETLSNPDEPASPSNQDINRDQIAAPTSGPPSKGTQYGASRRSSLDTGLRLSPSSAFRIVNNQRKTASDSTRSGENIRSSSLSKSTIADGDHASKAVENNRASFDFPPPIPLSVDSHKTTVESRSRNAPDNEDNEDRDSFADRATTIPTGRSSGASLASEVGLSSGGQSLREYHSFPYFSDFGEMRTSMSHPRPAFPFSIPTRGGSSMQSTDHGVSSTDGPTNRDRASVDSYTSQSNSGVIRNPLDLLSNPTSWTERELPGRANPSEAWRMAALTEPELTRNSEASFVNNPRKRKGILEPQARTVGRQRQPDLVQQTEEERFVRVKAISPQKASASLPHQDSPSTSFDINQPLRYLENLENVEVYHTLTSWKNVVESAQVQEHRFPERFEDIISKIFGSRSTSIRDIIEFSGLRKAFVAYPLPWDPQTNEFMLEFAAAIGFTPEGPPSVFTPDFCLEASRTLKSLQTQSERNYAVAKKYFSTKLGDSKLETLYNKITQLAHLALIRVGEYFENAAHLSKGPYSEEREFAGFKAYGFYTWFFLHFSSLHEKSLDDRLKSLTLIKHPDDLKEMAVRYTTKFLRSRLDQMKSPQNHQNQMQALMLYIFIDKEGASKEVLDEAKSRLSKFLVPGVHLYHEPKFFEHMKALGSTVTNLLTHEKLSDLLPTKSPTIDAYSDHIEALLVVAQLLQDGRGILHSNFMQSTLIEARNRIGSKKYYERVEEIESKSNEIKLFIKLAEHMGWTSPFARDPTKIEAVKVRVLLSDLFYKYSPTYETARLLVRRFHPNNPQLVWDELSNRAINQVQSEYGWLVKHLEGPQILTSQMNDVKFKEWLQDVLVLGPSAWTSIRTDTESPPRTRREVLSAIKPMADQYEKIRNAGEWREMKGFIDRFMTGTFRAKVDWISEDLQLEKPWLDVLYSPKGPGRSSHSQLFKFLDDPTNAHVVSLVVRTIGDTNYQGRKRFILLLEESRAQGLIRNM